MGTLSPAIRSLKQSLFRFFSRSSRTERSSTGTTAVVHPEKSSSPLSFVFPTSEVLELPSGGEMAPLSSFPTGQVADGPIAKNDRWLGFMVLQLIVANVTLRSISPYASETERENVHKDMMDGFRYEECYKALCRPSKPYEPETDFRDLLLGHIGHIHSRDQSRTPVAFWDDLEKYVDDPRRYKNEKCIIHEGSHESSTGALSRTPLKFFTFLQKFKSNGISVPSMPLWQTDNLTLPGEITKSQQPPSSYTVKLKLYCDAMGFHPLFSYDTVGTVPVSFICTITYGDLRASGRVCGSKKLARHEASEAFWRLLHSTTNS
ncbi:hypothetical protein BGZ60DRAFT_534750 [Tricladium varicosporioides]|nr:hypothetical protein BGZ60DRAFT_534750 [Hymenoscyphus varicosporioides]